jgi:glycosyltransferase involved in cell wall biosynthesis
MRVLLDCRMASWTGIGRYSTGLARELAKMDGLEIVQVIEEGSTAPVPDAETVTARSHAFYPTGGLELGRIVATAKPDLVHCLHVPTPIPVRHPLAVTIHDLMPLRVPEVMPSFVRRTAYRWWNARAASVAGVLLANSQATATDIRAFFPRANARVRVVLHAADDFADGEVAALPAELAAGGPYLLSMGNTKPHKDLPTLLRAFAQLDVRRPDLRLLLVGRDEPGYAASVLGDTPAARRVTFTGHVDDATLRALYAGAEAFVFPSRYEGFGLPPLEAMASGVPVVCSDAASLPEVVGDAALLFDAGDVTAAAGAILRLLDDPALRASLVAAGHARAALFTWERTAEQTMAAYRELLEGRGSAALRVRE